MEVQIKDQEEMRAFLKEKMQTQMWILIELFS